MFKEQIAHGMKRREFAQGGLVGISAAAWVFLAARCQAEETEGIKRAEFEITTEEAFDAREIAAYQGNHSGVYRYIDQHLEDHLENIRRWLRQPSKRRGRGLFAFSTATC